MAASGPETVRLAVTVFPVPTVLSLKAALDTDTDTESPAAFPSELKFA